MAEPCGRRRDMGASAVREAYNNPKTRKQVLRTVPTIGRVRRTGWFRVAPLKRHNTNPSLWERRFECKRTRAKFRTKAQMRAQFVLLGLELFDDEDRLITEGNGKGGVVCDWDDNVEMEDAPPPQLPQLMPPPALQAEAENSESDAEEADAEESGAEEADGVEDAEESNSEAPETGSEDDEDEAAESEEGEQSGEEADESDRRDGDGGVGGEGGTDDLFVPAGGFLNYLNEGLSQEPGNVSEGPPLTPDGGGDELERIRSNLQKVALGFNLAHNCSPDINGAKLTFSQSTFVRNFVDSMKFQVEYLARHRVVCSFTKEHLKQMLELVLQFEGDMGLV